jgi:hypothetical protein
VPSKSHDIRSTTTSMKGVGLKRNPHYLLKLMVGKTGKGVIIADTCMTKKGSSTLHILQINI